MLYQKCNKDTDPLDINQASKATISSVPLLPAPNIGNSVQKGMVQKCAEYEFRPKGQN